MQSALVSIVITTKNEVDVIGRLLKSIRKQSYRKVEIIVVDNKSTDRTKAIAKKFTKKIYDKGSERSSQRNFGAQKAKGNYLLFMDADMELSERVVEACVVKTEGSDKIVALIVPEISKGKGYWEKVKAFERSFYNIAGDDITDAARFFRREVFEKAGGYDKELTGTEDWELTDRLRTKGFLIDRIDASIYHYERIPNLYSLLKKKYYYGLKSYIYIKKHSLQIMNPKIIYFLRPVFYKQWQRMIKHPVLTLSMFFMFVLEMIAGGLGYLRGRYYE